MAQHIAGTADEVRGLVPAALEAYEFTRDHVLHGGLVDAELKALCFRYLAGDPEAAPDVAGLGERERAALEWAQAIAWDSSLADDRLWERLHGHFSEHELVELGCAIGFELGQQHWRRSVGLPARG
jgi:alkylhydroperoxidase family enzyme